MASDLGMCFACTNSIKLTAPDTKTPLGSSIVSNKRSPKKPLHSRREESSDHKSPPLYVPFNKNAYASVWGGERGEEPAFAVKGAKNKNQQSHPLLRRVGNWLRTRCIGRGRYFMVLDILQTRDRRWRLGCVSSHLTAIEIQDWQFAQLSHHYFFKVCMCPSFHIQRVALSCNISEDYKWFKHC